MMCAAEMAEPLPLAGLYDCFTKSSLSRDDLISWLVVFGYLTY